jgi:hypothetical protein
MPQHGQKRQSAVVFLGLAALFPPCKRKQAGLSSDLFHSGLSSRTAMTAVPLATL